MHSLSLSTERLYYKDTYQSEADVQVICCNSDDQGDYVIFDKTLFHPQGGGQPSDKGQFSIEGKVFTVVKLIEEKGDDTPIKHYYTVEEVGSALIKTGQIAHQIINLEDRILYARLHTAGHLFANVVNEFNAEIEGVRGNHFPGQSFVVLTKNGSRVENLAHKEKEIIQAKIDAAIAADLKVNILFDPAGKRSIQIEGYKPFPCGGTHVQSTKELGAFSMRSFKREKNDIRVGYDVKN